MKKLCSKTLKTLINELDKPVYCIREKLLRKKPFVLKYTNIEKVDIFILHDKVALLMRRRSERGTRNCQQSIFRKFILKKTILKILYWKFWSKDECFMTLMKLRLESLFAYLSQCFGIYLVVFALKFFIHRHTVRGDLKSFVSWNQKS